MTHIINMVWPHRFLWLGHMSDHLGSVEREFLFNLVICKLRKECDICQSTKCLHKDQVLLNNSKSLRLRTFVQSFRSGFILVIWL